MAFLPLALAYLFLSLPAGVMYTDPPAIHPMEIAGYETSALIRTQEDYPMPIGNFGDFFMSYGRRGFEKQAFYNNYWDSVGGIYSNGDAELYNFFSLELNDKEYIMQEKGLDELSGARVKMKEHFLFPVAYYEFDGLPVNMTAFSPFLFNDLYNSTLPVYCFVFEAENTGLEKMRISLSLNFENDIGWRDPYTGSWNTDGNENVPIGEGNYSGFYMTYDKSRKRVFDGPLDGREYLGNITILTTSEGCSLSQSGIEGKGVAQIEKRIELAPSERIRIPFIIATCFPYFNPGGRQYSAEWNESWKVNQYFEWYWSNFYDDSRDMALYAMENYEEWMGRIEEQSEGIIEDAGEEAARVLLNSLHVLGSESFFSKEGFFFTIEGEFTLLHTMDVMLYAQPFLAEFFPEIARNIVIEYAHSMNDDGRVPHSLFYDYAENHEEPYFVIMAYMSAEDDADFAEAIYPYVRKAMFFRLGEDVGKDGLINNRGGDHSYDMWSAPEMSYINSLWLLALRLTADMASELGMHEDAAYFSHLFSEAQDSFVKTFWNGKYFDLSAQPRGNLPWFERRGIEIRVPILDNSASQIEQITGVLFAELLGKEILPSSMAESATLFVYENNFDRHRGLGWINGVLPNGCIDMSALFPLYSTMVWSGVQWVLAAQLQSLGFSEEAGHVARITSENQLYRGFGLFHLSEGYTNLFGTTEINFPLLPSNENFVLLKPSIYPSYPRLMACWLYYFAMMNIEG
jgi:uncharacterized protein (DUF608 family)